MAGAEIDYARLCEAVGQSRLALRRARAERREMVRAYVGQHYSDNGTKERVPVNLIATYVSIVGRNLIPKNPRVLVSTFDRGQKPAVDKMGEWVNRQVERMRLADTIQRVVIDALFSVGIAKVHIATPDDAAASGWGLRAGDPVVSVVDLDDFVYDTTATDFAAASFIGHRRRVPLEAVKNSKVYKAGRKKLQAAENTTYNHDGDEKVKAIGSGDWVGDGFEDETDLWEIYLPRHRLLVTFTDDDLTGADPEPLRVQRWVGPEAGPYYFLCLGTVPGNAMPKAPLHDLFDLHEAVNRLYRKAIRTADRIKENVFVQAGAMEDGQRLQKADDGDIIRIDNPDRIKQVASSGSALQLLLGTATALKAEFDFQGGNLALLGGLGPQSRTLGQDKILQENSSRVITDMQDRAKNFIEDVGKALCWHWWHHPTREYEANQDVKGVQLRRPPLTPKDRQADMPDVRVDPYSLQSQSPQARASSLNQVVRTVILPMAQLLQSQGIVFDVNAYLEKMAALMDIPDLIDIVTIQEPPADPQGERHDGPRTMPNSTNRTYTRENVSSKTRQGQDASLVNNLLSGKSLGGAPQGVGA